MRYGRLWRRRFRLFEFDVGEWECRLHDCVGKEACSTRKAGTSRQQCFYEKSCTLQRPPPVCVVHKAGNSNAGNKAKKGNGATTRSCYCNVGQAKSVKSLYNQAGLHDSRLSVGGELNIFDGVWRMRARVPLSLRQGV